VKSLIIAFAMYSKFPMPRVDWEKKALSWALCWFPLVGLAVGAVLWLWLALAGWLGFGAVFTAALALLLPIALSGGIHLDGFCDTCDALSSHQSRERKLEILKDSHTGAFAIICCGLYLLVFFAAWCEAAPAGPAAPAKMPSAKPKSPVLKAPVPPAAEKAPARPTVVKQEPVYEDEYEDRYQPEDYEEPYESDGYDEPEEDIPDPKMTPVPKRKVPEKAPAARIEDEPEEAYEDDGEEMDIDEFAQYACQYAGEIDCSISGKSMLALYERIEIMEEDGIPLTRANAEELIEEAADKAERPSLGKRVKGIFSSKYDKDGLLILKEEHFI